jgi:hypothetical protein
MFGVCSMMPMIWAATSRRIDAVGPYNSATSVCRTGGPGGASATVSRAPMEWAIGASLSRTSVAMSWLERFRTFLSLSWIAMSPCQASERMK